MIVDSSALIAILRREPERAAFTDLISRADRVRISAATLLETSIVAGPDRHKEVDAYVFDADAEVVPLDEALAQVARTAYAAFGKRSGSPARLNFGDCISYALAKVTDEPLLFKGDDFTHTDIAPAR